MAWPSVTSLDAVIVALVWQQLLIRCFCMRWSTWGEAVGLGATVWLIYVADRLLDAMQMDLAAPHTLRHRFYRRHARFFLALWIGILFIDTIVVVNLLPAGLIRGGLLVAAMVLVYGASIHFRSDTPAEEPSGFRIALAKEIRVGVLFALGVSLTTWTELLCGVSDGGVGKPVVDHAKWQLAATTVAMAILFASNCVLVACFERHLDKAQSFTSVATDAKPMWDDEHRRRWGSVIAAFAAGVFVCFPLPPPIRMAIACSVIGLSVIAMSWFFGERARTETRSESSRRSLARFDVRGVWVDAVLCVPTAVMLCWRWSSW